MMSTETGVTSEPSKTVEKSVGVKGPQAVQMLLKREAASAQAAKSAEHAEPTPAPKLAEETPTTATSEEAPASPQDKAIEPEAKAAKPEPEVEAPDEALSTLSQDLKDRIAERIKKEVDKRKALEAENSRLKALANAIPPAAATAPKAPRVESRPDDPLHDVMDPADLQKRVDEALEVKDWAQAQLDAEVNEARLGDKVYDKQALRNAVRNAERFVSRDIPKRKEFIHQKAQFDRQTAETFGSEGWMQDRTSEGYQTYMQILGDPDVAKRPNASFMAAVQVQGLLDVQRRMRANGKKAEPVVAPKPKAPGSQTASGAGFAPSREPGDTKAVKELQADLEKLKGKKGVTGRDVEAYFLKQETSRTTR
jgi:hypothetical protein